MGPKSDVPSSAWLAEIDAFLERAMPSEIQSAEWGVRALNGPFSRLKTTLSVEASKRHCILVLYCHLYNLRARRVGLDMIRNVNTDKESTTQP